MCVSWELLIKCLIEPLNMCVSWELLIKCLIEPLNMCVSWELLIKCLIEPLNMCVSELLNTCFAASKQVTNRHVYKSS
jgi:hypothetical protein